ncbi:ergothioneine biosynthesis protein EgtB [Candidatus Nitrosotenuis cloacae]|uniref:ergothioneine biosynthesis protein EgtB n=1 Tax=Candidatus Nitrosotenuis cloacae TaxID=1603555 RepID=UPI0022818E35|nr:ergothioneine biosynthesis protein EgtB [Candidatus Nitrosotenuis cloacae]
MLSTYSIADEFKRLRATTLEIVEPLEKDDYTVQTAPYVSPPKWHLGHTSWLFERLLEQVDRNYKADDQEFSKYLNSYYNKFGDQHDKASRGSVSRPTTDELLTYYGKITDKMTRLLEAGRLDESTRKIIEIGIHHECQHQELLVYDIQHILAENYKPKIRKPVPEAASVKQRQVAVDGGIYSMGYSGKGFCYDIEMPEHKVYLNDYKIDAFPVSAGDYIKFIESGGYEDYKHWLSDGWDAVSKNKWKAPMYWYWENGAWHVNDFLGRRKVDPNEPVCHVSFYEADAYCKWTGRRLPSEAEWEKAACWNEEKQVKTIFPWGNDVPTESHANLLESRLWGCSKIGSYPNGTSHYGCHQMIGDVWEWTSSEFVGYPGFRSGFSEYNDKWFTNQKVLRGGSFATPQNSIRGSYRNFFRLDERWMFSGFRCAEDS